ncbi:MAG: hypothetical protein RQ732_05165 [Methylophaga sp.]|nr:hypothetical protein [Methylophaga sp.]
MLTLIWPEATGVLQPINKVIWPVELQKILRKSHFQADESDYSSLLLQQFGQAKGPDLPLAALRFPGETAICADLCYLHADRDCLRLFHRDLQVSDMEAAQLQASLKPLLDAFQGEWLTYSGKHWGLRLAKVPEMQWPAIDKLEGQSIGDQLPVGSEQTAWRRLLNEIQMTLFDHPVNTQRETAGLLPVNAVWFSGAAALALNADWQHVAGDEALLKPLANEINANYQQSFDALLNQKHKNKSLIVLPAFDNNDDWQHQLEILMQQVFKPLWQQLRRWQLGELQICVPSLGYYRLSSLRSWL